MRRASVSLALRCRALIFRCRTAIACLPHLTLRKGEPSGFVLGTEKQGLVRITLAKGSNTIEHSEQIFLPSWLPNHRFNDGKVDPVGRFVAGTMGS